MSIFSRSTFGVARVLMAFLVFFCHVSETFNLFGFLVVLSLCFQEEPFIGIVVSFVIL